MAFVDLVSQTFSDKTTVGVQFKINELPQIFSNLIQRDRLKFKGKEKKDESESEIELAEVKPIVEIVSDQVNLHKVYTCVALGSIYCFLSFAKHPFN